VGISKKAKRPGFIGSFVTGEKKEKNVRVEVKLKKKMERMMKVREKSYSEHGVL